MTARFSTYSARSASYCAPYAAACTSAPMNPILDTALNLAVSICVFIGMINLISIIIIIRLLGS